VAADDTLVSVPASSTSPSPSSPRQSACSRCRLQGVEALAIPLAPVAALSARMLLYTVRKGDTLVTIADRFGVSLTQLRRWNKITGIKSIQAADSMSPSCYRSHTTRSHRRAQPALRTRKLRRRERKKRRAHQRQRRQRHRPPPGMLRPRTLAPQRPRARQVSAEKTTGKQVYNKAWHVAMVVTSRRPV